MRKVLPVIALAALLGAAGCGQDIGTYNLALDADRTAREKIVAAINLMQEVDEINEDIATLLNGTQEERLDADTLQEQADAKRQQAIDAFIIAQDSWLEAKARYLKLIDTEPDNPDYLNNLGNMIYFKIMSGLEGDYEGAREYLQKAVEMDERPIYKRNLDLLTALRKEDDSAEQSLISEDYEAEAHRIYERMQENRRFIAEIRALAQERPES